MDPERDLPDFHRIADILTREIPGARLVRLAGVGHMALRFGSWDQVGQFKRFLGEVAPALGG